MHFSFTAAVWRVVPDRPLGIDLVRGVSGITALGGVSLRPAYADGCYTFRAATGGTRDQDVTVDATAEFIPDSGHYTIGLVLLHAINESIQYVVTAGDCDLTMPEALAARRPPPAPMKDKQPQSCQGR